MFKEDSSCEIQHRISQPRNMNDALEVSYHNYQVDVSVQAQKQTTEKTVSFTSFMANPTNQNHYK